MISIVTGRPDVAIRNRALELARHQDVVFIGDPAPLLCKHLGWQTLYEMPPRTQTEARLALLREHRARVEEGKAVFDHSVVGWLADWMRWHWSSTTTETWDGVMSEARSIAAMYDSVVHVEQGPPRGYDGHAWLDARNAAQIEMLMRHLYEELGLAGRLIYAGRALAA
jgi:hypothetical protein